MLLPTKNDTIKRSIVDFDKNIEFFLSATINCTKNGIINNNDYDYETSGFPFLKNLGKVIFEVEKNRKRLRTPDLSKFKMTYDR